MKPTQLSLVRYVGPVSLHPAGTETVVAVRRVDLDTDDYTSQLWSTPTGGGPSRQLTHAWRDSDPVYSPDGRWIAFVRSTRDEKSGKTSKPQVWVMPSGAGEARRLTDHPLGAEAPAWSADSTRLAYLAREAEEGRYGTDEKITPDKEPPRRITRMLYRRDGVGFLGDRPRQIWVTALDGEPTQITTGDVDHDSVSWSPVDDLLTFVAAGHEERMNDLRSDVWVAKADGTDVRALSDGSLSVEQARFSPDGASVVFAARPLGENRRSGMARHTSLWSVPLAGSPMVRLTDEETINSGGTFEVDADGVLFLNEHRGSVQVLLVPFDGGEPTVLVDGHRQVQAVAAARTPAGRVLAATVADGRTWGDVLVVDADGTERTVTDVNAGYRAEARVFDLEEVTAPAPDGYPVHGWLIRPDGEGPHPLLLMIHGGPFAQYGWQLFDEGQVYAGAGYAVLFANPRGSSGYGQAHGQHILGDVGERSTRDLMALLDSVLAGDPSLDASRVGVLGGSHGGYMTTWLAGHEGHRFKAAVSERAVNAIDSFTGASDIGWFFADALYGTDVEGQRRQSPLSYVGDIDIPMLIIHSEHDWRCPVEQAQRLYVALRNRGVPAEMLLFPGEGHELSRSGLPSHRLARFDAILDWFGRHV